MPHSNSKHACHKQTDTRIICPNGTGHRYTASSDTSQKNPDARRTHRRNAERSNDLRKMLDAGRCAGRTDYGPFNRNKPRWSGRSIWPDDVKRRTDRTTKVDRSGGMVLDPLAEVSIGVLVAVRVSRGQFVMDILGYREWCQGQQKENQAQRKPASHPLPCKRVTHRKFALSTTRPQRLSKIRHIEGLKALFVNMLCALV